MSTGRTFVSAYDMDIVRKTFIELARGNAFPENRALIKARLLLQLLCPDADIDDEVVEAIARAFPR